MATALLAKQNAKVLEAAGIPATGENLYMAHNIGPSGFIRALQGKASPKELENMNLNGRNGNMTPQEFVKFQKSRFNKHYREANEKLSTPVTPVSNSGQASIGHTTSRSNNTSIENNIGEVKVYTAATDAQGIAKELNNAIGYQFNTYVFDRGLDG